MTKNAQMNHQRVPLIVGTIFVLVGSLFCCGGTMLYLQTKNLLDNGERAEGTVMYIERSSSSYYPVFEFHDKRGRKFEVRSPNSSKNYAPDDTIAIVYDPKEPLSARILDIASYWPSLFLALFGGLFFSIGCLVAFFRNRFDENGEWVFGRKNKAT